MKKLALLVIVAYTVLFMLLTWPWLLATMGNMDAVAEFLFRRGKPEEILMPYRQGLYWAFIGSLLVCQAGLLLTPVRIASRRPVSRRSLYWPVIVAGFLIGALVFGLLLALQEALKVKTHYDWVVWAAISLCVLIWLLWSLVFCRLSCGQEPKAYILQQCKRLLQGGAIAFLVAVPCHIVARNRTECCAGFLTFIGLTFGVAVMLLAFGPGIYFLYAERWRKLHPHKAPAPAPADEAS
jgi:hypothetical protein